MDHTRHLGIFQVPRHFRVGIVGAGGIGAMTALVLAKMGVVQMDVWDDDVVSEVNLPTQLHPVSDIGNLKVSSLQETLCRFSDEVMLELYDHRILAGMPPVDQYDLFITAVDSIKARQEIWSVVKGSPIDWLLDMRMAAEQYQHFLVNMSSAVAHDRYDNMLMSLNENDVEELPCTEKATFYTASIAAGHAGVVLRNILRSEATSGRVVHYIPQQQILNLGL